MKAKKALSNFSWICFGLLIVCAGTGLSSLGQFLASLWLMSLCLRPVASSYDKRQEEKKVREKNNRLNNAVKRYFSLNDQMDLGNGILIKKGPNEAFDNLKVLYHDEIICYVGDYKTESPEFYNALTEKFMDYPYESMPRNNYSNTNTNTKQDKTEQPKKSELLIQMDTINELNIGIENQEITSGLYQTAAMIKTIDHVIEKHPDKEAKTGRLKSFYLPSLITILQNYIYLYSTNRNDPDLVPVQEKLIKTIHLVNEALESILNSMNDDEIIDMNSDMSVLETMLKQDGLVKDGTLEGSKK